MPKKRWTSDGPRQSASGWGFDFRLIRVIENLSNLHKRNREEVEELRKFFADHPEHIPTKRELDMIPPEKLIERIKESIKVFERERERRRAIFNKITAH